MKTCYVCKEGKPSSEFGRNRSRPDGLQNKCRPCKKLADKKYYETRDKERTKERTATSRYDAALFLYVYKLCNPCVDCGEPDPIVLDFDHLDPKTKAFGLSEAPSKSYSRDRLIKEIAKCEVVCSNCHRRRTAKSRNYLAYRLSQEKEASFTFNWHPGEKTLIVFEPTD